MTRDKDNHHLVVPQRFFTHGQDKYGDRHVYASRTRFIPKSIVDRFQQTSWPVASPSSSTSPPAREIRIDAGAKMRTMWR
jgi:DNA helicase-2/ATP-dependent DNA helicase PcrA